MNPLHQRRRGHHRLPGRLDVQDVHHGGRAGEGLPLAYTINSPTSTSREYIVDAGRRPPAGRRTCTARATPGEHGRRAQHVDRVRQLGQHLLRPAGASRSARRTWSRRRRSSASPSAAATTPAGPPRAAPTSWGAFTLGVSLTTPLELANAYATLAADGQYCEPIPVQRDHATRRATSSTWPTRAASRRISTEVARAAVDAARCPVGDRSLGRKCPGATAAQRPRHRRQAGRPASPAPPTVTRPRPGRDDQAVRGRRHHGRPGLGRRPTSRWARRTRPDQPGGLPDAAGRA